MVEIRQMEIDTQTSLPPLKKRCAMFRNVSVQKIKFFLPDSRLYQQQVRIEPLLLVQSNDWISRWLSDAQIMCKGDKILIIFIAFHQNFSILVTFTMISLRHLQILLLRLAMNNTMNNKKLRGTNVVAERRLSILLK